MIKDNNLIIGSGVLGAYLAKVLIKKKKNVIVTSRTRTFSNYRKLKIFKNIKVEKLDINKKNNIKKILKKYLPENIFYFAGQSFLPKSYKLRKETINSHYVGTKNFIEVLKKTKMKPNFFKANSGYIFKPINGRISISNKFSKNQNPYVVAQQKTFKLLKKSRRKGFKTFNLVFLSVESFLRKKEFFVKKVCINAKNRKKILVGNLDTYRDYSFAEEIAEAVYLVSKIKPLDIILSTGKGISGKDILKIAYNLNNLDYKKFYNIDKKFIRKDDIKYFIGHTDNHEILKKKFNFKFKIHGKKLIKKIFHNT